MSDKGLEAVYYAPSDLEFLSRNVGFTDENRDGVLTRRELETPANNSFRDFYATNLTTGEKAILSAFTRHDPLTRRHVAVEHDLMHIALKFIRYRERADILTRRGLPDKVDLNALAFDLRATAGEHYDKVVIDVQNLRTTLTPETWDFLLRGDFSAYKTHTLALLRHFLKAGAKNQTIVISFADWQKAWAIVVGCPAKVANDTEESTWNEVLQMWLSSDPLWHQQTNPSWHALWRAADWVYGKAKGGLSRTGRTSESGAATRDLRIRAAGVDAYVRHPENFLMPTRTTEPPARSPLRKGSALWRASWPQNAAARVVLADAAGFALHLDASPGASVTAYQNIDKARLGFNAGAPLLRFSGFSLNVDASHGLTRFLVQTASVVPHLFGKRLDVETLTPLAVTVYQNRLCLTLSGRKDSKDTIKPVGADDLLFDIGPFIRSALNKVDPSGRLANTIFNASGDVYADIPVVNLVQAVVAALQLNSTMTAATPLPNLSEWEHEVAVQDVSADFSALATGLTQDFAIQNEVPALASSIGTLRLKNGRFHGAGKIPSRFLVQGTTDIELRLTGNGPKIGEHNAVTVQAEVLVDTAKRAGYIRLKLPETRLQGAGAAADGKYRGEILIGLDVPDEALFQNGAFSLATFLEHVSLKTLIDLQKNRHDFLVAAFAVTDIVTTPETLALEKIVADFDLAVMDHGLPLYGIIHGGRLTLLKSPDDNLFTEPQLEIEAESLMAGGLSQIYGTHVALALYRDDDGVIHIKPKAEKLSIAGRAKISAEKIGGEILITPPNKKHADYRIQLKDVSCDIPDAEIATRDVLARGRTKAVLNGAWTVRATSLAEALASAAWEGGGKLTLVGRQTDLKIIKSADTAVDFRSQHLRLDLDIGALRFRPFGADGSTTTQIRHGQVKTVTPLLDLETKVSGEVSVQGQIPLVKFTGPNALQPTDFALSKLPALAPLPPGVLGSDYDESAFLDGLHKPLVDDMIRVPNTEMGLAYFINRDFPYAELGASFNKRSGFGIQYLPLATEAEYESRKALKGKETIRIPLFTGLLKFLNPHIEKNTYFYTDGLQNLDKDGLVQDFRINLNQPILFLGLKLKGIGVENGPCTPAGKANRRLYIYTEHGRIDVMFLLRLRYPCKMATLYRDLRRQGIKVKPGEIPSDMTGFGHLIQGLIALFEFDKTLQGWDDAEFRPITATEFEALGRSQIQMLIKALQKLDLPKPVPTTGSRSTLLRYVNEIALEPSLAKTFQNKADLFPPTQAASAVDVIDENLLLAYNSGKRLSDADRKKTISNNYRLLHLYLAPFLDQPDWVDFVYAKDLVFDADLKPRQADYGLIAFTEDAKTPFHLNLSYNPTDTEEHREHPGAYLSLADGENDYAENARFTYKIPSLAFSADFARVEGLNYYIGRATREHSANYAIDLSGFVAQDMAMTYLPPSRFNKPAFALFKADPNLPGPSNTFEGRSFHLDRTNEAVTSRVNIRRAEANNSYAYFYLGAPEEARDLFIDLADATLWNVESDIRHRYDPETRSYAASFSKIAGFIDMDNLPESRPRGLIYLGTDDEGRRRHLVMSKLEARGRFNVVDDDLLAQAHIGFIATLPDYFYESPIAKDLKSKGLDFQIQTIELDGTIDLILDGTHGGFRKSQKKAGAIMEPGREEAPARIAALQRLAETGHMEDVTIKLKGRFSFRHGDTVITLTDLTVPLDEFLLRFTTELTPEGLSLNSVTLDSLKIPAERALESRIDLNFTAPHSSPVGNARIQDGNMSLTMKSPFSYYMDQKNQPGFHTDGIRLIASDAENRLSLSTGEIRYLDQNGSVKSYQLDAHLKNQFYDLLAKVVLNGKNLKFNLK